MKFYNKTLGRILPLYGLITLAIVLSVNCIAYFGTRLFTAKMDHYFLSSSWDDRIPFSSFFVLFYVLAYVQWVIGFVMIGREDKKICYRYLTGEMIAKLLCMFCFIVFPTQISRTPFEEIVRNGSTIWDKITNFIYIADEANNLFPSIHCLESYVCIRTAFSLKRLKNKPIRIPYIIATGIMSLLVFASTVLLKQHVLVDMLGAIIVVEIGFAVSGLIFRKKSWD